MSDDKLFFFFVGVFFIVLLIVGGVVEKERSAYVASYMEQCVRDKPRYQCEMDVRSLREAWRAADNASTAAASRR